MCDKCGDYKNQNSQLTYEEIEEIALYLKIRIRITPQIGVICGTGLGGVTKLITNPTVFDYKDVPKFPVSTVPGHEGQLIFGNIGTTAVVCMKGRFHFFEGYPLWQCVLPVRVMKLLGVDTLILSNAAGSINSLFNVGDIMLISDHINFLNFGGNNPLRGPNDEKFGPRFVAMNDAYDRKLIEEAWIVAKRLDLKGVTEGVYACLGGPSFETVAELKSLRLLGADAAGMSTVHEVITAQHCGIKCFAFSLITNKCVMEYGSREKPDHEKILTVGRDREDDVKFFVEQLIHHLAEINL